ncbi:MAG TPA: hypothetical protein DDZ80_32675 [Cyanobacteria bacterium UBA8803]|nr:hypothetical protein [Cyanobacteria bacterium UBA9273]HBL62954.1 hypothetical protein [Cyanobacteria bacterium UBA8803]
MAHLPHQSAEDFAAAANDWNLEQLYADLALAKKTVASRPTRGLTEVEKLHLRGLLCGYGPVEIAQKLYKNPRGVEADLSKTLYRYVEALTNQPFKTLKNWRDVIDWLAAAGYRQQQVKDVPMSNHQDWGEAPDVLNFYGRTEELTRLKQWIVKEQCRLVAVLGMAGIGKTALSVQVVKQIAGDFEWVIWRSLPHALPVQELLANLLAILAEQQDLDLSATQGISKLLDCLRHRRCLLILDNWETVLDTGQLAGNYQAGYEDYGELLQRVAQSQHQSCLLLTSWEKPREVAAMEGSARPVRSLKLEGLGEAAQEILREKGLCEEHLWDELIKPYSGNPLALNIVATAIQEVFDGSVAEFLSQNTLLLGDFNYLLSQQFERLSELEKEIMYGVAIAQRPVGISELKETIRFSVLQSELITALESLRRRSLIEKVKQGHQTLFTLQPVVIRYIIRQAKS